jgi:predicted hydrocarbon binding protein
MEESTNMQTTSGTLQYFYPNRMGRVVILAMEEILGHSGVNAVLNLANLPLYINDYPPYNQDLKFPFKHISRLQTGLESAYGPRAGRGLAMRVGRACLKYGLREFGPELGLTDLAFRLLPLQAKLKTGSEAFAALFNNFTDQRVRLERDEKYIYWHIERCPLCWERQTDGPCCHLAVGLLQEALYWVSGGKYFEVEEKKCIAWGDNACTIVIDRAPMG